MMAREFITNGNSRPPKLYIEEEPEDTFRFRYSTEMNGTHGSLTGRNKNNKTFPQVRLDGYRGEVVIRCTLYQEKVASPHPHSLVVREDGQDKCDPLYYTLERPESGILSCKGMGIIHTSKKVMKETLRAKLEKLWKKQFNVEIGPAKRKEFKDRAELEAKTINLNKVGSNSFEEMLFLLSVVLYYKTLRDDLLTY